MKLRSPLLRACCALFVICGTIPAMAAKPNLIIVMVDDMGFSDLGCYGSEIPTPHLDALAKSGMRFTQFYNTGRCCPTRASLLTGLYSHQAGIGHMTQDKGVPGYRGRLTDQCVTIAEVLNPAGYLTATTGKWHVGFEHGVTPSSRGFARSLSLPAGGLHFSNQTGFKGATKLYLDGMEVPRDDSRFNPPWYGSDLWTEWGVKFIDQAIAEEKPFFLYLAHVAPHFPCMAPEETIATWRGKYLAGWDTLREQRFDRQKALGIIDPRWSLIPRPDKIPAWDSLADAPKKRYDDMMAIYAAMITEIDKNIGKLVDALRERKQLDNTLILFLSDNGGNAESGVNGTYEGEKPGDPHSKVFVGQCWAHLNDTPFRKYKHYNHEGGIATPLIAHWPEGIKPGGSSIRPAEGGPLCDTPAHVIDLMATCVDLSGAEYPTRFNEHPILPMEGASLRPLLQGGELSKRTLCWEHEGNAALRSGDRKLVREGLHGAWELYDMKADRTEMANLAGRHPEEVAGLQKEWKAWATRVHVTPRSKNGAK